MLSQLGLSLDAALGYTWTSAGGTVSNDFTVGAQGFRDNTSVISSTGTTFALPGAPDFDEISAVAQRLLAAHPHFTLFVRQQLEALAERSETAQRIGKSDLEGGLTFLGLVGLAPRRFRRGAGLACPDSAGRVRARPRLAPPRG